MPPASPETQSRQKLSILQAMALLWTSRPPAAVHRLMICLHRFDSSHAPPPASPEALQSQIEGMCQNGVAMPSATEPGCFRLCDPLRAEAYRHLLDHASTDTLRTALYDSENFSMARLLSSNRRQFKEPTVAVAIFRLALFSGTTDAELSLLAKAFGQHLDWQAIIGMAAIEGFNADLMPRIVPVWRWQLYVAAGQSLCDLWQPAALAMVDHALALLKDPHCGAPDQLRCQLAQVLLLRGDVSGARSLLTNISGSLVTALQGAACVTEGDWAKGQRLFETALSARQVETGSKKNLLPASLSWLYPLSLLAQATPEHWRKAQKFCLGETPRRRIEGDEQGGHGAQGAQGTHWSYWALWAQAIDIRLDNEAVVPNELAPAQIQTVSAQARFLRLLQAVWLGRRYLPLAYFDGQPAFAALAQELRPNLMACGLHWLVGQVDGMIAVLSGRPPPAHFFVAETSEAWRDILSNLAQLSSQSQSATDQARLIWMLTLDAFGEPQSIEPYEQKRGLRGWNRPRPISLSRLLGLKELPDADARMCSAINAIVNSSGAKDWHLDRAAAIMTLIGHPRVCLADQPEQWLELVEGKPLIDVTYQNGQFNLSLWPPLRQAQAHPATSMNPAQRQEAEALRAITVIQDSPQRLRVIRLNTAQRRAEMLLRNGLSVPEAGREALDKTLASLAADFHIQADHASATRELAAESRLRAELSASGNSLLLRLVVAPLGLTGPRYVPSAGRERVIALLDNETVGTRRNFAQERHYLEQVLEALPFLDPLADDFCEWQVEETDNALAMVERLPFLPAICAVDWPKGKPVRIIRVQPGQIAINVKAEHDWFRLSGMLQIDEDLVLRLGQLLAAASSGSRFVPIGNGVYASLTRSLKHRLAAMAAVAEADGEDLRLPAVTAPWLEEGLDQMSISGDQGFRQTIEALRDSMAASPAIPNALQTELRPYQEDGFVWAMRLARAGLGGCLADDMGLGKTVQALAVLLARAAGGPALIIAPTSVCGNWVAESQRYAPSLKVSVYADANRDSLLTEVGAGQVVVTTYTLLQQAQDRFCALHWHTVIADEAQAIKNAAAKRSKAAYRLSADFRLALSGTPVENRLSELWSIMRFVAPGLLGSQSHFAEHFANPIERNHDRQAQQLLRRLVAPFILRRTKGQVLQDLPPRIDQIYPVMPEADEAAHYEALRREAVAIASASLDDAGGQAKFNILAQLTRLRRGACDPRLPTPTFPTLGAKVKAFARLAYELAANGHKTLVFSQFVDFLTLLREPLDAKGIRYQYLDGATPANERTRRVAAFQAGEGDLFLISLKAGGYGLNLTAADYVVITDPWWNPAAEDQAMGRAHRIGQLRPVTVYRMVTLGTVEERIVELHRDKRALAESVLTEGSASELPSTDELMALLRGV